MALAARRDARMSVAEYQVWVESRPDDERWELLDGEAVLMSPPKERHQRIVYNLLRRVGDLADARGCSALPGLAILSEAMDDFAPIPDVVVRCGPPLPDGYARDPVLIAEVLSPSTMANDRGRKVEFYLSVPSLQTFLIVYQNEGRVEAWQRARDWEMQVFGLNDRIELPELGGGVAVADIYKHIVF
jgi:Uma2 family endonuclease